MPDVSQVQPQTIREYEKRDLLVTVPKKTAQYSSGSTQKGQGRQRQYLEYMLLLGSVGEMFWSS